jgi:hypothetical protein
MLLVIGVEEVNEKMSPVEIVNFVPKHHLPTGGSDSTKYSNNTGYWDADILRTRHFYASPNTPMMQLVDT